MEQNLGILFLSNRTGLTSFCKCNQILEEVGVWRDEEPSDFPVTTAWAMSVWLRADTCLVLVLWYPSTTSWHVMIKLPGLLKVARKSSPINLFILFIGCALHIIVSGCIYKGNKKGYTILSWQMDRVPKVQRRCKCV